MADNQKRNVTLIVPTTALATILAVLGGTAGLDAMRNHGPQAEAAEPSVVLTTMQTEFKAHWKQQETAEVKQERRDDSQDQATEMLNKGINDGFLRIESRLAGMEAQMKMLVERQGTR